MSEENVKVEFDKTRVLTIDELQELIDDYGNLVLNNIPSNTHFVSKVLDLRKVERKNKEFGEFNYIVDVLHKQDGLEANFSIRISQTLYDRFLTNYPTEDLWRGKRAFFKKTSFKGKFPQFINIINNDKDDEFVKKGEFKPIVKTDKSKVPFAFETTDEDKNDVKDFNEMYQIMFEENPGTIKQLAYIGFFWKNKHPEQMKHLVEFYDKVSNNKV
jgi:hypothetical protein